jgi:hypothetical protein
MLVVDPHHWLDEKGHLPNEPLRLRRRILRVVQLIEYGGPLGVLEGRETLLECRKRPGGKPCLGLMWVVKTREQAIHAFCMICKNDEAMIHNWEETEWAQGMMEPVPMTAEPLN